MSDLNGNELFKEWAKTFPIWWDYYCSNLQFKYHTDLVPHKLHSFEDFKTKKHVQTGKLLIDDWVWRWPERFKNL
jgi:hypothetical protein